MAQLKDLIVNGNARIITDLNVNGYETVDETVKVGRDPTANLEVATKQYVDNHTVPEELFECTIGTTTYAQITSALSIGQIPYLNPGGYAGIAWLSAHDDDVPGFENYEFTGYYLGNTIYIVTCWSDTTKGTNGWETNNQYFIGTTVIDENSTNDRVPTALAVYNALQNAGTSVVIREWSDS